MVKSKKYFLIALAIISMLNELRAQQLLALNLQSNSSGPLLTKIDQYYKLDSYLNLCLNKLETCDNGLTLMFDVVLAYQNFDKIDYSPNYGRTVLISSGGESPYSTAGFYLHQVSVRGDNFLEFGLSIYGDTYKTKIYIGEKSRSKLSITLDPSSSTNRLLKIYIDGLKHQTLSPTKRPYISLNYNPYKSVRSLITQKDSNTINTILFNDTSLDLTNTFNKINSNDYKFGCFKSNSNPTDLDPTKPLFDQCRELCVNSENQSFLIKENKCICIFDRNVLLQQVNASCSDTDSWAGYLGTSVRFDLINRRHIKLNIETVSLKDHIEKGVPFGLKITNDVGSHTNYKLFVQLSDKLTKTFIGNTFLVHEYHEVGLRDINITAVSLSDPNEIFNTKIQINVVNSVNRQPMHSVAINAFIVDEKKVDVNVSSNGGHPHSCNVSSGDGSAMKLLNSLANLNLFRISNSYTTSGIYNISVVCRSDIDSSEVRDSLLIYLPNKLSGKYGTNEYNVNNFKQIFLSRQSSPEKDIDLDLPLVNVPSDMKLYVVDFFNQSTILHESTNILKSTSNIIIKIKSKDLKHYNDNYLLIKTSNNINLITYLITLEDHIEFVPEIKILNEVLRQNDPTRFEIKLKKSSNAIVRIEYGDGKIQSFKMHSDSDAAGQDAFTTIRLNNTYDASSNTYKFKVIVANHISKQESSQTLEFQSNLPKFLLTASNASDTSQLVTFRLSIVNPPNHPIDVANIVFTFDTNVATLANNQRQFSNYAFEKSNNYSLVLTYKYSNFGLFSAIANCSNAISSVIARTNVRIGTSLGSASGYLINHYANINEFILLNLKINGGNGYYIQIEYGDSNEMVLPWTYISTNGTILPTTTTNNDNLIPPKARFTSNGIQPMYAYKKPGEYEISVSILNAFSSLNVGFCSKVYIQAEKGPKESKSNETDLYPKCEIKDENVGLFINGVLLPPDSVFNFPKGIKNVISIELIDCEIPELKETMEANLKSNWAISRYINTKQGEFEEPIDKYCYIKSETNKYEIEPNEFESGEFLLKSYSYESDYPNNYFKYKNVLRISSSPIMTSLNSGQKLAELNTDEVLRLNFYSSTYDPDLSDKTDKSGINFHIFCIGSEELKAQNELISKIKEKFANGELDFEAGLNFNLTFVEQSISTYVYDKDCFTDRQAVSFDSETNAIDLHAEYMNLNDTTKFPILVQLVVNKFSRFTLVKPLKIVMNLSSIINLVPSMDLSKMAEQLDKLDDFARTNPVKALDILGSFVDAINTVSAEVEQNMTTTTTTTQATQTDLTNELSSLRGKMINTVGTIVERVDDPSSLIKAANTTASVSGNPNQMPSKNQETGSSVMSIMGDKAKNLAGDQDPSVIVELTSAMLDVGSNLFTAGEGSAPVVEEDKTSLDLLEPEPENVTEAAPLPAKIAAPLEFYTCNDPSCEEDFPEDRFDSFLDEEEEKDAIALEKRIKTAEIAKKTFGGMSKAGDALSATRNGSETADGPQGNVTMINKKNMAMAVSKKNLSESLDEPSKIGTDSGLTINLPKFSSVLNGQAPQAISTQFLMSNSNPFQGTSKTKQTSGTIVSLQLKDENGNPLKINNTAEPFNIRIPAQEPATAYNSSVSQVGFTYYKTLLSTKTSSLHIVLLPLIPGDCYHVYIRYSPTKVIDIYPDEKTYDYYYTLPNSKEIDDPQFSDIKYTAFIRANETKGNGTYYIGVKLAKVANHTLSAIQNLNSSNATEAYKSYFTIKMFSSACKYYDEDTKDWKTEGCEVGEMSTYNSTECLCYHLTTFGTDFYTPPNTIDFSSVFGKFKNLGDNAAVFSTVVSILGVYLLAVIYVRYLDKKDLLKWGATPLADNLPTDNYYYLISVQTGVGKDCGTTSKVGFVLSGELADSGVRNMTDNKRRAFKSGTVCNFIMSTEEPLGSLTYLRIWHDNSGHGSSKSWYLNVVHVVDLQSSDKSSFVCNNWLAVEKGDGLIDRVLPVACKNDLTTFKHLFTQSVKKKFTDNHLWFSVFSRPTKSSFTRVQRLSCCMSLLFCTMIANAMFYRSEENASAKAGRIELGPIKFSTSQLFTSIISTLIVVPVNVIIVTLFRKAKLKHHGIMPTRSKHVAKQQYWRRVKVIQNIDLPDEGSQYGDINTFRSENDDGSMVNIKTSPLQRFFSKPKEYRRESNEDARNKKQGRNLPHCVIYLSWFLVAVSILVPAFFVILYSLQWGKERSEAWLMSISLSFFQSLLVVDPLKVFIVTAAITFILRKPDDEDDALIDSGDPLYNAIVNKDEEYLHKTTASLSQIDIQDILESRRTKLSKLTPMDPEELERQRLERKKYIKMKEILREGLSYFLFLIIVLFLAHQSRSQNARRIHADLSNLLLTNSEMAFEDIKTRPDFWNYLETVFLPAIYAPKWYNNKTLTWREKLTVFNRNSLRVGAPRIRQLRVKENTCKVFPKFKELISHCRDNYNWVDDDTKDYEPGWILAKDMTPATPPPPTESTDGNQTTVITTTTPPPPPPKRDDSPYSDVPKFIKSKFKCRNPWCYQNTLQTKSTPIVGHFTTYKGGGYALSLGRTLEKSVKMINKLKDLDWVDQLTRAIFLEFAFYNPNVNLFSTGTLIVEFLSTGAAVHYQTIHVCQLYNYLGSYGIIVLVFEIIFVIFIVYFIITEILKLKSEKCAYFKKFWNLNEFIIISFSIVSMAMFGMRSLFTKLAIDQVHESELGEFVNFNTIGQWDEIYTNITAVIVFCATLKFLKLLRFNKRIGMLAATLRYACKDLAAFSVTFGIIFFAFTQYGFLIFGTMTASYSTVLGALASVFRFSLGQFNLKELQDADYFLGSLYFVLFVLIVIMGLMSMFVTILNEAFEKVKEDLENQTNEHEIIDFIFESVKNFRSRKTKLREANRRKIQEINQTETSLRLNVRSNLEDFNFSTTYLNKGDSLKQSDDKENYDLF